MPNWQTFTIQVLNLISGVAQWGDYQGNAVPHIIPRIVLYFWTCIVAKQMALIKRFPTSTGMSHFFSTTSAYNHGF